MPVKNLRIVFAGTPDFAAEHLSALLAHDCNVIGVYTRQDKISGRGQKITASPVKELALSHNITVFQPANFRNQEDVDQLAALKPDVLVVVAYGVILPKTVLDLPEYGCINIHGSLLPKYRGAAPIQRSIFNGDRTTGITVMKMNEGLDTGNIIHTKTIDILDTDTSESLFTRLVPLGCSALLEALEMIAENRVEETPQNDSLACYAEKITREEAKIDFSESADQISRRIRTYIPWPVANFKIGNEILKVHQAAVSSEETSAPPGTVISADKSGIHVATGNGVLVIKQLQFAGKKPTKVADVLNGHRDLFKAGTLLT